MSTRLNQRSDWTLAWRFALREVRGSERRFRVFLMALMLGVAAIGTVGSVAEAMRDGITDNARMLLGGDIELRSRHTEVPPKMNSIASALGTMSDTVQMRAMLQAEDDRRLVELKAVDARWPLVGAAELDASIGGDATLAAALANSGIVADPQLLRMMGLEVGDIVRLGETEVRVAAGLAYEPDRSVSFISFGPRVLISMETLAASELAQPGSFITYRTRLLLDDPSTSEQVVAALEMASIDQNVRVRDADDAAPGFDSFINRAEVFLVLVGLTALLIGGLGVAGAVRAWLASRMPVIATLKCLGAPAQLIFRIYLIQVMLVASLGVILGVIVAGVAPALALDVLANYVTVPLKLSLYPMPLLIAAGFGLLTSFLFALWPLAKAEEVRAANLFRSLVEMPEGLPKMRYQAMSVAALFGLGFLAFLATRNLLLTLSFIGGCIAALGLLAGLGEALMRIMRLLPSPHYVPARLALSAITRPGSPVRAVVIAFGLGLSVLVAVALSQANLSKQIDTRVAEEAPAWFFIDIQPHQIDQFMSIAADTAGVTDITKTPMLRGRVTDIGGKPSKSYSQDNPAAWVLRGDRALTWANTAPAGAEIVAGKWWPADYTGTPLVSMSDEEANELGVWVGDTVAFNVLGRKFEAEITNIRHVEWESFALNFVFILSPGMLEAAPHSWMATTHVSDDAAARNVEARITDSFSNVSAISVREAVATAQRVIGLLGTAVQATAMVTLIAGIAVLAGTVASTEAQRLADSVILKVLGATRMSIIIAWFLEYALLGALTAFAAALIGSLASWALITQLLNVEFVFFGKLVLITSFAGALATAVLGLAGAVRTLGQKPAPLLRAG
ncbi:ABC transporter permease [Alphaproteobacteria bacterium]|nr:ABC transporter permease [Alphaproteobacteria bacterium]